MGNYKSQLKTNKQQQQQQQKKKRELCKDLLILADLLFKQLYRSDAQFCYNKVFGAPIGRSDNVAV